ALMCQVRLSVQEDDAIQKGLEGLRARNGEVRKRHSRDETERRVAGVEETCQRGDTCGGEARGVRQMRAHHGWGRAERDPIEVARGVPPRRADGRRETGRNWSGLPARSGARPFA